MPKGNFTKNGGWNTKWTEKELNILKKYYPVGGVLKVQEILTNRSKKSIQSMAAKYKINQWHYNKNYFNKIDSEEKAYWLGFIWADGYITKDGRFGIELAIKDKSHLEKLCKDLQSNMRIKERKKESFGKIEEYCLIEINNKTFIQDLKKLGIIENKTYMLTVPKIEKKYYKDFIRGFFDGDGTYVLNEKNHNKEISCVCYCKDFLEWIQTIFKENNIESHLGKKTNKTLYTLRIYKAEDLLRFYYCFWDNATRFLDRKKEMVEKIYNYI